MIRYTDYTQSLPGLGTGLYYNTVPGPDKTNLDPNPAVDTK